MGVVTDSFSSAVVGETAKGSYPHTMQNLKGLEPDLDGYSFQLPYAQSDQVQSEQNNPPDL